MKIQDLKNLDLYKCSLQDINIAFKDLKNHLLNMIDEGKRNTNKYKELKKLHVLISRARLNMDSKGYMIGYNIKSDRLPNNKSVLN